MQAQVSEAGSKFVMTQPVPKCVWLHVFRLATHANLRLIFVCNLTSAHPQLNVVRLPIIVGLESTIVKSDLRA